jgi:L-lactate utilization protein LutB
MFEQTVEALKQRGFEVEAVATKQEALSLVMKEAESAQSVGWGGSESVKEIGARARLVESGKEIRDHQLVCDLFLLSANALTTDGRIVNIDGNGNRVAAITWGPKKVIFVIGLNKVAQNVEAALARARSTASPINAARFDIKTPCQTDGVCHNCNSPESICNYVHFLRNSPRGRHVVVLVGENLGY